jgi:hypothetical protein
MASVHVRQQKLQAAFDFVLEQVQANTLPAKVINALVAHHGASYRCQPSTNTLRVAGVTATCTWSVDEGLLTAWRKNAGQRLIMANYQ